MTIDFTKNADKLFSRVFYQVRKAKARFVVVYGGSASGKSYSVHQNELRLLMKPIKGDTLFFRKHGVAHAESCYKLLSNLIDQWKVQQYFKKYYSTNNRRIVHLPTGRQIVFKGVDDPENLKSLVGFSRIVLEEANQFTFDDFKEIVRRARGYENIQFILILNPISENHWIKTNLCDPQGAYYNDTEIMRFNYADNCNLAGKPFITESDIAELERLKLVDENQYRIYALGEWGVEDKNKKFVWAFQRDKHVKHTVHNPQRITWASFDFNVNPLTCTIFQMILEEKTVRAIECIKLPNSDIWQMCDRLKASYPGALWMVTGDSSGKNRQAISRDNLNYYHVIMSQLRLNSQQVQIPTQNPPQAENQLVVNTAFKLWNIEIDPVKCKDLVYDITYVEMGADKKIVKDDRNDDKQQSDFLDTLRYFINMAVAPHLNIHLPKH